MTTKSEYESWLRAFRVWVIRFKATGYYGDTGIVSVGPRGPQAPARVSVCVLVVVILASLLPTQVLSQKRRANSGRVGSLTITTEPNAIVWIDDVRRGVADPDGKLTVKKPPSGAHTLRVRANGFKEVSISLGARTTVGVRLVRTTDQAELLFQEAEDAREKARDIPGREAAAAMYREVLERRWEFPAAHVGLARVLMDLGEYRDALGEIEAARGSRPIYPEASAVEGRIYREFAFTDEAVKSFRRAISEGHGFQPEAYVGLARVWEDKGQYTDAVAELRKAIEQLSDSEPVIYQMLGAVYERQRKLKEAVAAYEKYLALAPDGSLAPAVRSIIDQLRREAEGEQIIP